MTTNHTVENEELISLDAQTPKSEAQEIPDMYLKLHQHVLDYQAGVPGAAEAIIDSFRLFVFRYYNFIVYGKYSLKDCSVRSFISLIGGIKKNIGAQHNHRYKVREDIISAAEHVRTLLSLNEPDDVMQILNMTLLEMALKYKDYNRPSFHNYIHKNYHFYVARAFPVGDPTYRAMLDDMSVEKMKVALDFQTHIDYSYCSDYERSENQIDHERMLDRTDDFIINETGTSVYDDEALNLNWINGVTCSEAFQELSPFERKILLLSYVDGMQDSDIAEEYGFCRATINRKKISAIKRLKDVIPDIYAC